MISRKIIYLKDLTFALINKELKSKYKSATLGFLWIFINPLLQMIILTIVFSFFFKIQVENYPLFVFSGLLPWTFFSLSLQSGTSSLINNRDLIKKTNFSRSLLPISSVMAHLFNFILALLILACFVMIAKINLSLSLALLIPIILLETILSVSITLILSSLDIYYRDVSFILQSIIMIWFYATPIFYPISMVPEKYLFLYQFNPMVGITTIFQSIFLNKPMLSWNGLIISIAETIVLLLIGILVFKKRSKYFADWI
jgi:lipopolysaccharide transport system permease protein